MARTKKQEPSKETAAVVTRAEKKDATKNLIKECLAVKPHKHNEIIDAVAKLYVERFGGEDADNINDVKGRVGSVLDIMKKESEIMYDGGMYALKARALPEPPAKKTTKKAEKKTEETVEEKPVKKTVRKKKETAQETEKEEKSLKKTATKTVKAEKKTEPLPPAPIQPIAPVAPVTPEIAPEPIPEEKTEPKKRGRKPKAKPEEHIQEVKDEKPVEAVKEEEKSEPKQLIVKEKAELIKKEVMDVSFLLGEKKPVKPLEKEEKQPEKSEKKPDVKQEEKPMEKPAEKPTPKTQPAPTNVRKLSEKNVRNVRKAPPKLMTADEKLCEAFLKRIRSLGGDYFEYYSVYLLERYSMKNGRRLEGLKISGGERDGGIDGEIELTDKLGFRETIYIQSKNWNPEKGDEKLWVVGETLLQQFLGACAYRQAKDGKQHCRGIFITTSRFTPEAKRILETMSDKIVGYDGKDLYEAAKECSFGLIEKNGVWTLDERILSGGKIFFNLY